MRERTGAAFIRSASMLERCIPGWDPAAHEVFTGSVVAINRAQLGIVLIAGAT
jgi:hypothetical protein